MIAKIYKQDDPEVGLELEVPDVKWAARWIAQLVELAWSGPGRPRQTFTIELKDDQKQTTGPKSSFCLTCRRVHVSGVCLDTPDEMEAVDAD